MINIVIEKGYKDHNGDITPIEDIIMPRKVLILHNFDNTKPLGYCQVYKENGILKADIENAPEIDGYPAIGYKKDSDGKSINLVCLSISDNKNSDPSIRKISEQTRKTK